jgi:RHS repeat-associated protein
MRVTDLSNVSGKTVVDGPRTTADGLAASSDDSTTYCYDDKDRVVETIDAKGNHRHSDYTTNSNVTSFSEGGVSGGSTSSSFTNDNLTNVTLPTGGQASMSYADAGNPHFPTSVRDYPAKGATNPTWAYTYNSNGDVTQASHASTDSNQQITFKYAYNSKGLLTKVDPPVNDESGQGNNTLYNYDASGDHLLSIDVPGSNGDQSFTYDVVNRVKTITDGKGQVETLTYDALDRVKMTVFAEVGGSTTPTSTHEIDYGYDENGDLTSRKDSTGTSNFTYDELNRMTDEAPEAPAASTHYTYDPVGNLTSLDVSDEPAAVLYRYDKLNLLTQLTDQNGGVTTFEYNDARNLRTRISYPNGVIVDTAWDNSKRMKSTRAYKNPSTCSSTPAQCLTYRAYDYTDPATGNDTTSRYSETDGDGNKFTYSYDEIGRLTRAHRQTSGSTELENYGYAYDKLGNMTSEAITGPNVPSVTTKFDYDPASELTCTYSGTSCATSSDKVTYGYDGSGNLASSSAGLALNYNAKNQTASVTPPAGTALAMEYADATQDRRTAVGSTRIAYSQLGLESQGPNNGTPHSSYFVKDNDGTLLSMIDRNDATKNIFYVLDALGSVILTTDQSGNVIKRYRYEPYGKEIAPTVGDPNPYRFASGYFDESTGMLKFGTRYYMPDLARWTQRDPKFGQLNDPMSLNTYGYVGANPINFVDSSGQNAFSDFFTKAVPAFAYGFDHTVVGYEPYAVLAPLVSGWVAARICGPCAVPIILYGEAASHAALVAYGIYVGIRRAQ